MVYASNGLPIPMANRIAVLYQMRRPLLSGLDSTNWKPTGLSFWVVIRLCDMPSKKLNANAEQGMHIMVDGPGIY